jgi:alpha-methylacyl-CoA racemase
MAGPLQGIKIIELAALGPAPYACMLLADAGAEILTIDRPASEAERAKAFHKIQNRSRRSVGADLKDPAAVALIRELVTGADVLIEGFRPGVTERLGLGPAVLLDDNPALVYGRMTGWGQEGSLAQRAGHDINYIAMAGALWSMGRSDEVPSPPLNLVGDFGGGGMLLAFGVLAAVLEAKRSGRGQVVDAAMIDGTASLMHYIHSFHEAGEWVEQRGSNPFDSGAPFYEVYETSDGGFMSVGANEPKFYSLFVATLGLVESELPAQRDRSSWPQMKERFRSIFKTKTRDEWAALFSDLDACVWPLLTTFEAPGHPALVERAVFVDHAGVVQPAPAPRFSETPSEISKPPSMPGGDTREALASWGIDPERIDGLLDSGALYC